MTATISPSLSLPARLLQRECSPNRTDHRSTASERGLLGSYVDAEGRRHEVVARSGASGSVIVVDRDALTLGDRRLVAHLACDEPADNAQLICDYYLADVKGHWCRKVTPEDLAQVPFSEEEGLSAQDTEPPEQASASDGQAVVDRHGRSFGLGLVPTRMSIPGVRWKQSPPHGQEGPARVISARDVIAYLESYEPVRELTRMKLSCHRGDPKISVSVLRGEMQRICASRIVLNRGLREAVVNTVEAGNLSLSEIAMRCGRVKYDSRGNISGEATWLSRRLGLVPEGGEHTPTPWVHSDVLALIARRGLGISPQEVELG
jgi:hypothetical protein